MGARYGHGVIAIVLGLATLQLPASRMRADDKTDDEPKEREQIGQALGEAVFRDEIRTASGVGLEAELHRLFLRPVSQRYREERRTEIEPTEVETATFVKATMLKKKLELERTHAHSKAINERIEADPELRRYRDDIDKQLARGDLSPRDRKELEHQRRRFRTASDEPVGRQVSGTLIQPQANDVALRSMASDWKYQKHLYDRYGGGRLLWQQLGMEAYDAKRKWLEAEEKAGHFQISDPELRRKFYDYWHGQGKPFLIDDPASIREYLEPAKFLEAIGKEENPARPATDAK